MDSIEIVTDHIAELFLEGYSVDDLIDIMLETPTKLNEDYELNEKTQYHIFEMHTYLPDALERLRSQATNDNASRPGLDRLRARARNSNSVAVQASKSPSSVAQAPEKKFVDSLIQARKTDPTHKVRQKQAHQDYIDKIQAKMDRGQNKYQEKVGEVKKTGRSISAHKGHFTKASVNKKGDAALYAELLAKGQKKAAAVVKPRQQDRSKQFKQRVQINTKTKQKEKLDYVSKKIAHAVTDTTAGKKARASSEYRKRYGKTYESLDWIKMAVRSHSARMLEESWTEKD